MQCVTLYLKVDGIAKQQNNKYEHRRLNNTNNNKNYKIMVIYKPNFLMSKRNVGTEAVLTVIRNFGDHQIYL